MMKQQPVLSFEFAAISGDIKPLTFTNPIKCIVAYTTEDILPCFQLIENALQDGYYVAGYLSYESAPAFNSKYKVNKDSKMPLLWFGVFTNPEETKLTSSGPYSLSEWVPSDTLEDYQKDISSIKKSIEEGNTYQTNYTIRMHSNFEGDDIALFEKLKNAQLSNYCAYLNIGEYRILSASPELFFHLKGDQIITRPMKGTISRGKTVREDIERKEELYHSVKNRAENVMIVDLLRNDLSVVSKLGTVQVDKLFEIETYPTVHQMTSTITATLNEYTSLVDIFKALFPCGSITGAPKISTMDVIQSLETTPREVYCGAIGYITPEREAIFNVPIRTVIINSETDQATYGVGGGITWDSTSTGEFDEILAKASVLKEEKPVFQLLESLLLQGGEYFLLTEHLKRLQDSVIYFNFSVNLDEVSQRLLQFANECEKGDYKVRLLLNRSGDFSIESQEITPPKAPFHVSLAERPVNKEHLYLYHKTTNREVYSQYQNQLSTVYDVLLWNEDQELTEFTNGNVVLEIDGYFWTPPIDSGLLAGTFREHLLKEGKIKEKTLTITDLKKCTSIWFINSVRKWIQVELI